MIPWLGPDDPFPPVERARRRPNGLLAAGGDLSSARLIDAYAHGIFPWFSKGDPVLWWCPDPRMVLFVSEFHVSKSLGRVLRSGRMRVTFDTALADVMAGCAQTVEGRESTWITENMIEAYTALATRGIAHSVETWMSDELVGGLYGVALGRMFFGESMFTRQSNASKVALVELVRHLDRWGFEMIDCQMPTGHLTSFGAREIPRTEFLERLRGLVAQPGAPGPWAIDRHL